MVSSLSGCYSRVWLWCNCNPSVSVVKRFQSYVDPEEPEVPVGEEDGVALPLGETTLTCNLGVPIIVVCCKVCMHILEYLS